MPRQSHLWVHGLERTIAARKGRGAAVLLCSGQYREEPILKILVHLIDRLVHGPGEMLVKLAPGDGKRLRYRTFAVEKYEVAEHALGVMAALLRMHSAS